MPNEQSFVPVDSEAMLSESTSPPVMTRRQMLRRLATTSAVLGGLSLAGGSVLTACGGTGSTEAVTLLLGAWPVSPLPSTIKQSQYKSTAQTDIFAVAEVSVVNDWLKKNPNVTLKHTAVLDNSPKTQQIVAAIAARTAPALYTGFSDPATNHYAVELGYAADPTDLNNQYNPNNSLLADYAVPLWESTKNGNGRYYGLPSDLVQPGSGVFYRRDIAEQKGLILPTPDWTWEQFRTFATEMAAPNQTAMGAPSYMIGYLLNSNQLDPLPEGGELGSIPTPNSNWHQKVSLDPWLDEWKDRISLYRDMVSSKLINQDSQAFSWEGAAAGKMADGTYNMSPAFFFLLTFGGYAPVTPTDMPKKYGKKLDELVAFITYPHGSNGAYNSNIAPSMGGALVNPFLKGRAYSMAGSFYFYNFFGDGYINYRYRRYEKTKNPQDLFDYIASTFKAYATSNPKVPDITIYDVYGKLANDYEALLKLQPIPQIGQYLKPDKQAGPTEDAHNDLLQSLSQGKGDAVAALHSYQSTWNQEAGALQSSISSSDYKAGAKKFYADLDKFWAKTAPDFHSGDWQTFYSSEVLPALS